MRKILSSLFLLSFLTINLLGQNTSSRLHLKMHNRTPFRVILNQVDLQKVYTTHTLGEVAAGQHYLKVLQKALYQRPVVIFEGYITIAPCREIFAYIDDYHQYVVHKEVNLASRRDPFYNPYIHADSPRPLQPRRGRRQAPNSCADVNQRVPSLPHPPQERQPHRHNRDVPPLPHPSAIEELRSVIKGKSFDEERLKIAEQAIQQMNITSEQLKSLLEVLSFEKNKLALAKKAYPYVVNKEQYFVVFDAFKFKHSVDELQAFLDKQ